MQSQIGCWVVVACHPAHTFKEESSSMGTFAAFLICLMLSHRFLIKKFRGLWCA